MTQLRIACVGDNCIDRYVAPQNFALVGGNAVNVAVHLALLGCEASYFGAAGADRHGLRLSRTLATNGVSVKGLRLVEGQSTATTDIATDPTGERHFLHEDFGACRGYGPDDAECEHLAGFDHVHIGWLDDGGALKRRLHGARVSVSQDLSVNNGPEHLTADHLAIAFASCGESGAETAARSLGDRGAALTVMTMGGAGSLAWDGRAIWRAAALPVDPVDTTGAGDSFIAGFLNTLLRHGDIATALADGGALARRTCLHPGGFPQSKIALGITEL